MKLFSLLFISIKLCYLNVIKCVIKKCFDSIYIDTLYLIFFFLFFRKIARFGEKNSDFMNSLEGFLQLTV